MVLQTVFQGVAFIYALKCAVLVALFHVPVDYHAFGFILMQCRRGVFTYL